MERIRNGHGFSEPAEAQNTTIGVVAANVAWTQSQATKVAQMAHDGLARAIRPVHMPFDGDTVFALGAPGLQIDRQALGYLGAVAADVMALAVVSAIVHASGISGYPAYSDLTG